jgi:large subunit ribosomal protein L21
MYAICTSGGHQYKVSAGDVIKVEKLAVNVGEQVKLDVLMLGGEQTVIGAPTIEGAYALAEVTYAGRGEKINIFKYKAKKNQRKRQGHRQPFTELKIIDIVAK